MHGALEARDVRVLAAVRETLARRDALAVRACADAVEAALSIAESKRDAALAQADDRYAETTSQASAAAAAAAAAYDSVASPAAKRSEHKERARRLGLAAEEVSAARRGAEAELSALKTAHARAVETLGKERGARRERDVSRDDANEAAFDALRAAAAATGSSVRKAAEERLGRAHAAALDDALAAQQQRHALALRDALAACDERHAKIAAERRRREAALAASLRRDLPASMNPPAAWRGGDAAPATDVAGEERFRPVVVVADRARDSLRGAVAAIDDLYRAAEWNIFWSQGPGFCHEADTGSPTRQRTVLTKAEIASSSSRRYRHESALLDDPVRRRNRIAAARLKGQRAPPPPPPPPKTRERLRRPPPPQASRPRAAAEFHARVDGPGWNRTTRTERVPFAHNDGRPTGRTSPGHGPLGRPAAR